jgi:hypothetical protein
VGKRRMVHFLSQCPNVALVQRLINNLHLFRRLEEASAISIQSALRGKAARGELERRKAEKANREEEERKRKEEQRWARVPLWARSRLSGS